MSSDELIEKALRLVAVSLPEGDGHSCWLDAATGAGNMTVELAKLIKGRGRLMTIDIDELSWHDWAKPRLSELDLLDTVEFRTCDFSKIADENLQFDGIFTSTTLSCMGLRAIDAIAQLPKVLNKKGLLVIHDYLPQRAARNECEELVNDAWRLYKASQLLSGRSFYDEYPPDFICHRLEEAGFENIALEVQEERLLRSSESLQEWLSIELNTEYSDHRLVVALEQANERCKAKVREAGEMLRWSGSYLITARLG